MATATRTIIVTDNDRFRLERLINGAQAQGGQRSEYLDALWGELGRARTVKPTGVPPDVVTMNSTVRLRDLDTGESETYTLVYPEDADASAGRISVLAPVGTAAARPSSATGWVTRSSGGCRPGCGGSRWRRSSISRSAPAITTCEPPRIAGPGRSIRTMPGRPAANPT
jgi:regulator of nucleoside diphosphate kinase